MLPARAWVLARRRWLVWRARFSTPALLARYDEDKVVARVTALNGGLAILAIGLFAWVTDLPLVFPALGPSAFILFSSPLSATAAPRSVILGHLIAMVSGYAAWRLISHVAGQPVSLQVGGWPLVMSASLGLAACCLFLVKLACRHPPACGSAMVVALGAVTAWSELLLMGLAVIWLVGQAVAMNRIAGVPAPTWHPTDRNPYAHQTEPADVA